MFSVRILLFISALGLVACENIDGDGKVQLPPYTNHDHDGMLLKNASVQDFMDEAVQCPEVVGENTCYVICHVPPGNPDKAKTIFLPDSAVHAHLHHGGPHHTHHDYFGYCDDGSGGGDDGSGGGDDGSGGGDDGTYEDPLGDDDGDGIPNYCEMNYEIDQNCDGIDDETGELLY